MSDQYEPMTDQACIEMMSDAKPAQMSDMAEVITGRARNGGVERKSNTTDGGVERIRNTTDGGVERISKTTDSMVEEQHIR